LSEGLTEQGHSDPFLKYSQYQQSFKPVPTASTDAAVVQAPSLIKPKPISPQGLVRLALHTLATFDLDHPSMLAFMADCAVRYMEADSWEIRKEAALACARLLERRGGAVAGVHAGSARRMHAGVEEVLDKLLVVAVADPKPEVRECERVQSGVLGETGGVGGICYCGRNVGRGRESVGVYRASRGGTETSGAMLAGASFQVPIDWPLTRCRQRRTGCSRVGASLRVVDRGLLSVTQRAKA
jgi:hypothetical protein